MNKNAHARTANTRARTTTQMRACGHVQIYIHIKKDLQTQTGAYTGTCAPTHTRTPPARISITSKQQRYMQYLQSHVLVLSVTFHIFLQDFFFPLLPLFFNRARFETLLLKLIFTQCYGYSCRRKAMRELRLRSEACLVCACSVNPVKYSLLVLSDYLSFIAFPPGKNKEKEKEQESSNRNLDRKGKEKKRKEKARIGTNLG